MRYQWKTYSDVAIFVMNSIRVAHYRGCLKSFVTLHIYIKNNIIF